MKQSCEKELPWPPIISGVERNIFLKFRDSSLTLIGWFILFGLLQDFWFFIYAWLKPPIFILLPEDMPDWAMLWQMFHPFAFVSFAIMFGIILIAIWRRKIISRTIEHYYLSAEDEEDLIYRETGLLPSQIQEWHRLGDVDIYLDDEGNIANVIKISK